MDAFRWIRLLPIKSHGTKNIPLRHIEDTGTLVSKE